MSMINFESHSPGEWTGCPMSATGGHFHAFSHQASLSAKLYFSQA